jgi:hypothetical protein
MRGRTPAGPEYVERLIGSDVAKERLKTVLETLAGNCRVSEACQRLDICEQRFHQIRQQALEGALGELEPRPVGRPAQTPTARDEEVRRLREELAAKDFELRVALARTEVALILPRVTPPAVGTPDVPEAEKKTPRPGHPRSSLPGKKKST